MPGRCCFSGWVLLLQRAYGIINPFRMADACRKQATYLDAGWTALFWADANQIENGGFPGK